MMNKNYFFLSVLFLFCLFTVNTTKAQVLVYEDFEDGSAVTDFAGWNTGLPPFTVTTTDPCSGLQSVRVGSSAGNITSIQYLSQVTTGLGVEVSFEYKVVDQATGNPSAANSASIALQYSIDGGATWTTYTTLTAATLDCSTQTDLIPATSLPAGSDFGWRMEVTNLTGNLNVYLDQFTAIEQVSCVEPVKVEMSNISFDSADISWIDLNNPNATEWEIAYCTFQGVPTGGAFPNPSCNGPAGGPFLIVTGTVNADGEMTTNLSNLTDGTTYYVYVRAICGPGDNSAWSEVTEFQTIAQGSYCDVALEVNANPAMPDNTADLPYNHIDQTDRFGSDDYNGSAGGNCNSSADILDGFEVVYHFVSSQDDILTVDVTGLTAGVNTGVYIYAACADIGTICLYGAESQNGTDIEINSIFLNTNDEIYIVIATTDATGAPINSTYEIDITGFECNTWVAPDGDATYGFVGGIGQSLGDFTLTSTGVNPTINGATLQWYPDLAGSPDTANPIADPSSVILNDQDVYHVTQNIANCESPALMVTFEEIDCTTDIGGVTNPVGDSVCESGSMTLSVTEVTSPYDNSTEIYWYDAATGGEIVGVSDTFTTPVLNQTTSYWASKSYLGEGVIDNQASPGPLSNVTSTGNNGLGFTVTEPMTIVDVSVYAAGGGLLTLALEDNSGNEVYSKSIALTPGTAASPTKNLVSLNWAITSTMVGNGPYRLLKKDGPALMYSTAAEANFPYNLGTAAQITTGRTATSNSNNYYYFYDWTIRAPQVLCETLPRVEAVATVHEILPITTSATNMIACVGGTTDLTATSADTDYQYTWTWTDANGPHTDSGATITATIIANTTFTVEGYNPNTTCSTTATIDITANGVGNLGVIPVSQDVCADEIVRLTAGSEIYDFNNGAQGWTTQNQSSAPFGNAAGADWSIVNSPYSPPNNPQTNLQSNDGSPYFISVADQIGPTGVLNTRLISPSINLVGVAGFEVTFDYFFRNYDQGVTQETNVWIEVSDDGGNTWQTIKDLTNFTTDPSGPFIPDSIDLSSYVGNDDVKLSFHYEGDWGWWIALDNIVFSREFADGQVSWSPITDLYFDEQATIPYDGSPVNELYFTQSAAGQYQYTALLDFTSCPDVSSTVDITVYFTGLPTTSNTTQNYSTGDTTGDLDVTGTDIKYYILNQNGDYAQVTLNYLLKHGTTYYVTQTLNNCESDYLAITVELDCPAPTNLEVGNQQVSQDGTVSVILNWDIPANVASVQSYIIKIVDSNDQEVYSTAINDSSIDFKVVNGLPANATLTAKLYSVCDSNIPVESTTIETPVPTVNTENYLFNEFTFYPNPTQDVVAFENNLPIEKIEVYTLTGQKVMTHNAAGLNKTALSLGRLSSGSYFAAVYVQNSKKVVRIIKE